MVEPFACRVQHVQRLELPLFIGDHLYGWLTKVECYFYDQWNRWTRETTSGVVVLRRSHAELAPTLGSETTIPRLEVAEGGTSSPLFWFVATPVITGGAHRPRADRFGVRVSTTIWAFSSDCAGYDGEWLTRVFMVGLREEIQAEQRLFGRRDLQGVIRLALCIEVRNWTLSGSG